jgi:hypothetical protein
MKRQKKRIMRSPYRYTVRRIAIAGLQLLLACSYLSGIALNVQEHTEDPATIEARRSSPEYRHEYNKELYGEKAAEEIDRLGSDQYWKLQSETKQLEDLQQALSTEVGDLLAGC